VVIDSEFAGKIKKELADNISKEYKHESMKNHTIVPSPVHQQVQSMNPIKLMTNTN